ncbi:hypothetical protein AAMO2058_000917600 [Amorphochlora amoebiformis]
MDEVKQETDRLQRVLNKERAVFLSEIDRLSAAPPSEIKSAKSDSPAIAKLRAKLPSSAESQKVAQSRLEQAQKKLLAVEDLYAQQQALCSRLKDDLTAEQGEVARRREKIVELEVRM